jgi:hypothetical protein
VESSCREEEGKRRVTEITEKSGRGYCERIGELEINLVSLEKISSRLVLIVHPD